jgi:hypothetical protein
MVRGRGDRLAGIRGPPQYMEEMPDAALDPTDEWRLPPQRRPPLLGELVERIDEALATARSSESAVMTVGAAALDAAEQARRAAESAERSAELAGRSVELTARRDREAPGAGSRRTTGSSRSADDGLRDFGARADQIAERLRALQRIPLRQDA